MSGSIRLREPRAPRTVWQGSGIIASDQGESMSSQSGSGAAVPIAAQESSVRVASARAAGLRSVAVRYATAALLAALALLASLGMQRLFAFPYPFLFLFFGVVIVSAWIGGTGVGLFSVLLSTLLVDYFFVPPFYSWQISATAETYFVSFVVCALVASWISSVKKKSEESLQEARDHLEIKVSERTAALMKTQAQLAHLSRALSMGELTASIAHEVSQPITAIVTNGHACLEWLSAAPPNIEKARQSAQSIIQDGTRAGDVLARIRAIFRKEPPAKRWLDLNNLVEELVGFLRHEAATRHISIRTDLTQSLPSIKADHVQLQQVVLNLVINAMESMAEAKAPKREVVIRSRKNDSDQVLVAVEDCGSGIKPEIASKIFETFFTTKPQGIGMGLSIGRSIIESHGGRLWASANPCGGAIFEFTLPIRPPDSNE
jgi:signal transduction histidine kinase